MALYRAGCHNYITSVQKLTDSYEKDAVAKGKEMMLMYDRVNPEVVLILVGCINNLNVEQWNTCNIALSI